MKKIILILFIATAFYNCSRQQSPAENNNKLPDGFYQVNATGTDSSVFELSNTADKVVEYNSIYNEQDFTKVQIDTSDFVPLELEQLPLKEKDADLKSRLSITLSAEAAQQLETFTAKRLAKEVAIVLDGEAITMHRIKDTIRGGTMQISWCGENACEKLYTRLKGTVKK
ncbi:MAG: hypothetical protein K0S33_1001 [Bacteroidetes bacterium]|jgi:preprotein translocase subunit SecD|nr:hypothetical protein [Bacteroidota bacterium]